MAGQIIKRGERTWMVRVFLGRDALTGKRRYHNKTVHGTKKDAQKYLNGVLREKDLGRFCEPTRSTLNAFLERWLADAVKPRVRLRTHDSYEGMIRRYIREGLGPKKLQNVTALDVQNLYGRLLERGLSPATIRRLHNVLGSAFKQAVKWSLIGQNPMVNVEAPKNRHLRQEEKLKVIPLDRVQEFLAATKLCRWGIALAVALGTGMRPGEYLALKWSDFDVKQRLLRVQRSLTRNRHGGGWSFQPPKTKGSVRAVSIPSSLVADLLQHQQEQTAEFGDPQELMFTTGNGQPLFASNLRKRHLKPLLRDLGMDTSLHLYSLRHGHATILLSAGVHPKLVAERLGHASVRMTLDVYSHVVPTMQRGVAEQLDSMLYGGDSQEPDP